MLERDCLPYHVAIDKVLDFDPVPIAKKAVIDVERTKPSIITLNEAVQIVVNVQNAPENFRLPLATRALHALARSKTEKSEIGIA